MKDKGFIFTKDRFEIGAIGIHPKLDHAARGVKAAWNVATLALTNVTDIHDDH